jgi:Fe-S cluster biogenesis protein NfuA
VFTGRVQGVVIHTPRTLPLNTHFVSLLSRVFLLVTNRNSAFIPYMSSIEQQIEQVFEQVRPALRMDGGGIELVKYDPQTGAVHVRLRGACVGCPMSQITLNMGVEAALRDAIPEVTEVIAENSDEPHESNL